MKSFVSVFFVKKSFRSTTLALLRHAYTQENILDSMTKSLLSSVQVLNNNLTLTLTDT